MPVLYRVHEKANVCVGMYFSSNCDASGEMFDLSGRHPAPRDDSKLLDSLMDAGRMLDTDLFFGFASIDQMRNWIYKDQWFSSLHLEGMVLSLIEVDTVYAGNSQAVIHQDDDWRVIATYPCDQVIALIQSGELQ